MPLEFGRKHGVLLMVVAVQVAASGTVRAADTRNKAEVPIIAIESKGAVRIAEDGVLEERLVLPVELGARLNAIDDGDALRLVNWPVAPGDRRTVVLEKRSVYGPATRLFEIGNDGVRELPRSPRKHFIGVIADEPGNGVLVVFDPRSGGVTGMSVSGGETFDLEAAPGDAPSEVRVVATSDRIRLHSPFWECGEESIDQPDQLVHMMQPAKAEPFAKSSGPLEAVLAVDTDTELLSQKFNNNTGAAADYVADLIAAMNVMYSRDLDVTLIQGTTFLRTGTDPYSANSSGSASSSELNEFGSYWKNHYGSVDRALAAMLSGKSPSSYSASGIAWVGGLCSSNVGYSFSKVFKINYLSGDAKLVGHEIGHNFGSPHTHCYSPAIDHCYANESGCYSGATSCPGGAGTVMSYCHITGCGNTLDFHPTVINRILTNYVNPSTGVCIFETTSSDTVFDDSFETGGLGAWSSSVP